MFPLAEAAPLPTCRLEDAKGPKAKAGKDSGGEGSRGDSAEPAIRPPRSPRLQEAPPSRLSLWLGVSRHPWVDDPKSCCLLRARLESF